jgi:hypothetical protein
MKLIQKITFMGLLLLIFNGCQSKMTDSEYHEWVSINGASLEKEIVSGSYLIRLKYLTPEIRTMMQIDRENRDSLYALYQQQHFFTFTLFNAAGNSIFTGLTENERQKLSVKISKIFQEKAVFYNNKEKIKQELYHYEGEIGGKFGVVVHFVYPSGTGSKLEIKIESNKIFPNDVNFEFNTENYPQLII